MDLKEEHLLGKRLTEHWYYVSNGRALEDFLKDIKVPEVLDIGTDDGFFSRLWNRFCVQSGTLSEKSDLRIYPELINSSLTLIHDIERKILFPINRWGGLTISSLAVPIDQ